MEAIRMLRTGTAALAASLVVLMASACGGDGGPNGGVGDEPALQEISAKDFDPRNFDRSTTIDNPWFPLEPGTQLVYEGSTREEGKRVPHRVAFTVTDLAKEIGGVRNVVVWDRDWRAGELQEAELALFAQDDDGNVWHLGQYPEEYEAGKVVATPAWFHGLKRARAGIAMKAHPRLGAPAYSQGFAPSPINWVDRAEVHKVGTRTCVPLRCYQDVLVAREFEPDKPESYQLKYYARGVGNVKVGWLGRRDEDRELLVLVKVVHLDQQALAEVRREALRLEARAYQISEDVYGRTPPSKPID
jgi:uncharacterized protein YbaA (DUF1428 family)